MIIYLLENIFFCIDRIILIYHLIFNAVWTCNFVHFVTVETSYDNTTLTYDDLSMWSNLVWLQNCLQTVAHVHIRQIRSNII